MHDRQLIQASDRILDPAGIYCSQEERGWECGSIYKIMAKGIKKKEHDKSTLIVRGNSRTYYPFNVIVPFDSLPPRGFVHPSMKSLGGSKLNIPTFNSDSLSFTPAFRLPSDQLDHEHYKQKHRAKLQQHVPIPQEAIMMPRPKDKRYCHVCDCRFEDYQEHIDSERHRKVLSEDKYQHRIERLSRKICKSNCRPKIKAVHSDREESCQLLQTKENERRENQIEVQL